VARHLIDRETTRSFEVHSARNPGTIARRQVDSLADLLDPGTLARVRLLVSELVSRAAPASHGSCVQFYVTVTGGCVRATVDSGAEEEERPALDWALFLVRRMADRWGVASGVWFEIDLPQRKDYD
jgi:hypothetical protein